MKRLVALTLVMVLVLGVAVTGYAAPNWKQGGGLPPGIQKKVTLSMFTNLLDLDQVSWAKNAMEKMSAKGLIKGYGDNTFKPNGSVSQLEAVVMALRIMGWEEDACNTKSLPSNYRGSKLDPWAVGYVKVAADKGILDVVDLMYFNPNSAAKRWEVAKYFVRALDKEDEAEDHMDDRLDFRDFPAMPVGAVGYIYVMNELGLMVGNADGTFNPNKTVSRAEMAVLLERIDGKVDNDTDGNEIYGRVLEIDYDDYQLKLDEDGEQVWYEGIEGVAIYRDGEYFDFDELKRGDYVELLLDSSGKVIFIELKDENEDKLITDYRGEVRDIDEDDREITIKSGTAIFIFSVKSDADIRLNGEDADLEDIEVGDIVRLKVDDRNRVIRLDAQGDHDPEEEETAEVEGTIYAITLGSVKGITIKTDSGRLQTYNVDSDTEITLDGRTADLSDLESGMAVEAVVEDGTAITIDAETDDYIREVEGTIYRVDDTRIRVKVGSTYMTFDIDDDTLIYLDSERAEWDDLMVDMAVIVRYRGDTALRIQAESLEAEVEGVITDISTKGAAIRVKVGSTYKTFEIDRNTDIRVNGKSADYEDLTVNMKVTVRYRAELALRIRAENSVAEVEGIITAINITRENITVKTGSRTNVYSVKDADIYVEDSSADVDDLVVGMTVELELINGSTVSEVYAQLEKVEGAVVSVDTDEMKITLRLYDINVTYDLDEDVEVELDGEEADLEDLTPRTQVELEFDDGLVEEIKG